MPTDDFLSLPMHARALRFFRVVECDCPRSPVKKRKRFQSESKISLRQLRVGPWAVCLVRLRSNFPPTFSPRCLKARSRSFFNAAISCFAFRLVSLTFRTMIIAGPGVLRDGAAADVADFVTRTGAGVMTTMGAIGVIPFDHPAWRGVVGVQADDPALGGLDECELVIVVGVDDDELGESLPMNAQLLEVESWHLPFLATDWPAIESQAVRSSLVEACAAVFGDHRDVATSPLHPVRAVLDVFDAIDPDVQVYVDGGPAGFWFARGVVPVPMGRVVVPARSADGFAISAAIVSALDGTRSVAITYPGSSLENELLDLAAALDLGIVVEQWGDDVDGGDPSQHRANLVAAMSDSGVSVTGVAVDLAAAAELVDLAGPVVAWPTFN